MKKIEVRLEVSSAQSRRVGQLAEANRRVYFEYDPSFAELGIELSPFRLPVGPGLHEHTDIAFGPLPGLFDDSLPDGWGMLLMDRHFRRAGFSVGAISPLDRLAYLGTKTMGALTYHPPQSPEAAPAPLDLAHLASHAEEVLEGKAEDVLPELLRAGGSPGGARPKVTVAVDGDRVVSGEGQILKGFTPWIVKFSSASDSLDAGPLEFAYSLMACAAGLELPPARLFEVGPTHSRRRYFGTKRFDRTNGGDRVHMHTFGNLIHANFRIPSTDYIDLIKVTRLITRQQSDVLRAYRLMAFNVAAHNRDDHAKNFAFLLSPLAGHPSPALWRLSPAFDLTFCQGPGGEHSTSVAGEGRAPSRQHCLEVARRSAISAATAGQILDEVADAVSRWPEFAEQAGCRKQAIQHVQSSLRRLEK